jgi:hypothetical protein
MLKPVKVLIIWIPTGKTHLLWHLEVRRVIFYPAMKFALLYLAEGPAFIEHDIKSEGASTF